MHEYEYGSFGNKPEITDLESEDDPMAEHLMGCIYGLVSLALIFVFFLIIYFVYHLKT